MPRPEDAVVFILPSLHSQSDRVPLNSPNPIAIRSEYSRIGNKHHKINIRVSPRFASCMRAYQPNSNNIVAPGCPSHEYRQ